MPLFNTTVRDEPLNWDCEIWPQESRHHSMVCCTAYFDTAKRLDMDQEYHRSTGNTLHRQNIARRCVAV